MILLPLGIYIPPLTLTQRYSNELLVKRQKLTLQSCPSVKKVVGLEGHEFYCLVSDSGYGF